jgi:hypothetical protein
MPFFKFSSITHDYEKAKITLERTFPNFTMSVDLCFSSEKILETSSK